MMDFRGHLVHYLPLVHVDIEKPDHLPPKYSSVPNRRVVRNKRAGGKILKKTLNVQARIDVQGENFLENQ